jgi:glucose-1-phosphate thymidylyltransferase
MNLWTFTPDIYEACDAVTRSERGEFELPQAVRLAVRERGMTIRCEPFDAGVLDLSHRTDIASVADRLRDVHVAL